MTGSEAGRILACAASAVLPRSDGPTEWTEEGELRHLESEVAAELGDLDSLPPRVASLIAGAESVSTEAVYVYDAASDTARPLPGIRGRAYPAGLGPFEVPMTIDLIAFFSEPRRATIIENKLFADQGPPKEHGQLMTQAVAVARAFGLEEVTIAIAYLGTHWVAVAKVDMFELAAHAERLQQLHIDVAAERLNPRPRPGPHCRHCPAFFGCPAQAEKLALVASGETGRAVERMIPFEEDAAAAAGMALLADLEMLTKRLDAALRTRAKTRPVPLAAGMVWGPRQKPGKEQLTGTVVYAVALELYGPEKAASFVEMRATKERIKEVIGELAPRGQKTSATEALLALVRQRGGAPRKNTTKFEAYDPQRVLAVVPATPAEGDDDAEA
jgi:hypothetical protein